MCHRIENPQCYCVDLLKDLVGEVSQSESLLFPSERVIVKSINMIKEGHDK